MKNKLLLFIAVLVTSAMNALSQGDKKQITEVRTSQPYHYIFIKGEMDIELVQGDEEGVVVEGNNFQINNTITMLRNDTLFVYQTNVRSNDSKRRLTINIADISMLEVSGNAKVDCSGHINTDYLTIRAYDGAQIKLDVRALKIDSKATGCSFIDVSGITASVSETMEDCGIIDSELLDVMDEKRTAGLL